MKIRYRTFKRVDDESALAKMLTSVARARIRLKLRNMDKSISENNKNIN